MNNKVFEAAAAEVAKLNLPGYEKEYLLVINGVPEEVTVKVTRKKLTVITEALKLKAETNTISALPAGGKCTCCNGSGRS